MGIDDLIRALLEYTNPAILLVIPASALAVKGLVSAIKAKWTIENGNLIQSLTIGLSFVVVFLEALMAKVYTHGLNWKDAGATLIAGGVVAAAATGIHEWTVNRNPEKESKV